MDHMTGWIANKERKFGLLMGGLMIAFSLYKLLITGHFNYYLGGVSLCLLLPAIFQPRLLAYPRRYWDQLTYHLSILNTTIWLTIIYILIFIPLSLLLRIVRRNEPAITSADNKKSYWQAAGQAEPSSLKHQF